MLVLAYHNDLAEVYINGLKVLTYPEGYSQYHLYKIPDEAKKPIRSGKEITVAVHGSKAEVERFIDVGLVSWDER